MADALTQTNLDLEAASPALAAALSPLGRRIYFPPDIPFQAAQARGKAFNATIGQVTDGRGRGLVPPALAETLGALSPARANRAFLYSPVEGIPELRQAWARWQQRELAAPVATTLPIVTSGLTHGLSIVADLFGGEGRAVVVPAPFWGNYRQVFATRTGARVIPVPAYQGDGFAVEAPADALATLPAGEPAVVLLNLPSNPGGYSLTQDERRALRASLVRAAEARPLVVLCDDAYAGLVYEEAIPRGSLFWDLVGAHSNLVPIKADGATKELSYFGGRLGFLTFAFEPGSSAALALESKVKGLVRSTVGSPVAVTQVQVLEALESATIAQEVEAVRRTLAERYRVLKAALANLDPALARPLPFNSGCFALLELSEGVNPEAVRLHLLEHQDTGIVSVQPRYLRIAYCAVAAEALPELVERIGRGVAAVR